MNRFVSRLQLALITLFCSTVSRAQSTITLPRTGSTMWDKVVDFMQTAINFAVGPYALAISAVLMLAAVVLWWLSPKEGFIGVALRVLAGAVAVMNIPVLVNGFRFG